MKFRAKSARLAVFFALLVSAWAFGPRFTRDQYELPKHAGLLLASALLVYSSPGNFAPRRWLAFPALASFMGILAAGSLFSGNLLLSSLGDNGSFAGLITWALLASLFLAGASMFGSSMGSLSALVVLAGTGSAIYALLQQLRVNPFPGELFHHVSGFTGNPDFLAQQIAMTLPFALEPALKRNSFFHWACSTILFLALALSASRAGLAAGLIGAGLLAWFMRDLLRRRVLALTAGAILPLACIVAAELMLGPELSLSARAATLSSPRSFIEARGDIWRTAAKASRVRPFIGWGPDNMPAAFSRLAPRHWSAQAGLETIPRNAHNEPLNLMVIGGILGLGCYIWILACAWNGFITRPRPGSRIAAASVAACLFHNLFSFSTAATAPLFWLILGYLSGRASNTSAQTPATRWQIAAAIAAASMASFGAIRLAADAYAFWGKEGARHGRPALELGAYTAASRLAPWDPLYLVNRAYAREKAGYFGDALALYRRAVALNPLDALNWGSIGRAGYANASRKGDIAGMREAFAAMQHSLLLAPSQPALYTTAIQAAHELGFHEEAGRLLSILTQMNPNWAEQLRKRMEAD